MSKCLYRDPKKGKLGGVCAGLAAYFGVEIWILRVLTVIAFFIGGSFVVVLMYLAGWLLLDKKPEDYVLDPEARSQRGFNQNDTIINKGQRRPVSESLRETEQAFSEMESRVKKMEAYVTSSAFDVARKFRQL